MLAPPRALLIHSLPPFPVQVEESEGLAEEAFTSQSGINHDLVAKDPVGVAVEQQNGVLPGIHQRLGTVLSARGDR